MRSRFRISSLNKGQLRRRLAVLALALALPTAVLVWQTYSQLKWESFHHYRNLAEDLSVRIDGELLALIGEAEARSFADYSFLVVEGDAESSFLQRSPLSMFPVTSDFPGVLGYFQVDGDGQFTTPVLPQSDTTAESVGIPPREYRQRLRLAREIMDILRDNRLVQSAPDEPYAVRPDSVSREARNAAVAGVPPPAAGERQRVQGQAAFDALSAADGSAANAAESRDRDTTGAELKASPATSLGKVADLNLETPFERKLEKAQEQDRLPADTSVRGSRKERVALPETVTVAADESGAAGLYQKDVRIDTFESEIDPLEFSLLDSGHFVLFRKVWRNRERFIQGILIERDAFMRAAVDEHFKTSVTAGMSDLIVAYDDDVIHTGSVRDATTYVSSMLQSPAPLLYRNRLSSPVDRLELIFRIRHLPPGPGATVLGWVTLVLAIVFCGGFLALYRLGAGQIDLARKQQDFVSAVSHELKTPLTSIRMYGEMLKEGWADPQKRQQYYEYIHDESERLTRLIANVLQLASITRNKPQLDVRPVTVAALMGGIEIRIANQVRLGGFELRIERDPDADPVMVAVDTDCFMQIIINLVDNAIKFSSKAATRVIELSSRAGNDGNVHFAVRDYGPGVPKNQMKKIFRLFYRSESELTRETVGTGIGLAIVHQLTLAMGGKIDVVNRDPGAEFILSMPGA